MTAINLATQITANLGGYSDGVYWNNNASPYPSFRINSLYFDPAVTYTVTVTFDTLVHPGDGNRNVYVSGAPTASPGSFSYTYYKAVYDSTTTGDGPFTTTATFTIGPGLHAWDDVVVRGNAVPVFSFDADDSVSALDITPALTSTPPAAAWPPAQTLVMGDNTAPMPTNDVVIAPRHRAWFVYTPPEDQTLSFDTFATEATDRSDADTVIYIYSGSPGWTSPTVPWPSPWPASQIANTDDAANPPPDAPLLSQMTVSLTGGVEYRIVVGAYDGTSITTYHLNVMPVTTAMFSGTGTFGIGSDEILTDPDFQLTILNPTLDRAPTSLTVTVDGARPETDIRFYLDTTSGPALAYTTTTDVAGSLQPMSISVNPDLGGAVGTRTLTAEQDGISGGTLSASATYTLAKEPQTAPAAPVADAAPVLVPGALAELGYYHWVAQDLLGEADGGIGSYVFPINPREMSSPHYEATLSTHHTTASSGRYLLFQAGDPPKEWTFSGVAISQDMVEKLQAYRNLNRRFYTIDHRNRAWKTVWTNLEIVPRRRTNYNGEDSDWITDFTVTAMILDQNWQTPT